MHPECPVKLLECAQAIIKKLSARAKNGLIRELLLIALQEIGPTLLAKLFLYQMKMSLIFFFGELDLGYAFGMVSIKARKLG